VAWEKVKVKVKTDLERGREARGKFLRTLLRKVRRNFPCASSLSNP
jgi:hypothetical protein